MKGFRKRLQVYILAVLAAVVLSGCVGQEQEMEESETVTESAQAEAEEPLAENDNPNVPKNTASETSSYVKVEIHNEEEYRGFVSSLEEYLDRHFLILDMQETDTVIYLDEILAYHNFRSLSISGGIISARNVDNLKENPLKEIDLYHNYAIEENILSQMPALQNIEIWLNSSYTGVLPAKELIHNTDCDNIAMIWDDDKKYEVYLEGLAEWDEINTGLLENNSYLKGLYVWNEDDYNYISYEFCKEETENACDVFICIKDRESYGEKYFDILTVPIENIDYMSWTGGSRMMLDDINFDGYRDLIFTGAAMQPFDLPRYCIGFLWNEKEQRYEWNATAPKHYRWADDGRKRIIDIYPDSLQDDYFIYEYHDGIFTEKKLEVTSSLTDYYLITWQYYEEGELLKRLEKKYDEETKLYYITYEENGIVTEEVIEKNDYKYIDYMELGKEYFPEFDFYWAG